MLSSSTPARCPNRTQWWITPVNLWEIISLCGLGIIFNHDFSPRTPNVITIICPFGHKGHFELTEIHVCHSMQHIYLPLAKVIILIKILTWSKIFSLCTLKIFKYLLVPQCKLSIKAFIPSHTWLKSKSTQLIKRVFIQVQEIWKCHWQELMVDNVIHVYRQENSVHYRVYFYCQPAIMLSKFKPTKFICGLTKRLG